MLQVDEARTRELLDWTPLVERIRAMFQADCEMPVRTEHFLDVPGEAKAKLLLKPAWTVGDYVCVKVANVFPGNAARGLPSVNGVVVLFSGRTGEVLALVDGGELTARRTAAASALASDYLARRDSTHLLMMATGRLSTNLIEAHAAMRPIRRVTVWGRDPRKADAVARTVAARGLNASATEDVATAAGEADIVSCATLATEPILRGEWLKPGCHVDLVGSFTPDTREADDEAVRRATVFVDTRAGAVGSTGDIVQPIKNGALGKDGIAGDLYDLTRGRHPGRRSPEEITLFKSVGAALEDLAGAVLVYERSTG